MFVNTLKPPRFDYHRAGSCEEAVSLLRELGEDAKVLAGGQSLIPLLNFRLAQPSHLVAIGGADDLRYTRVDGDELVVGAAMCQSDVEHDGDVRARLPLLADALELVAHPPIRHRGTVCGSLAHADPASELPATALALGATFVARSADAERRIAADDFFLGPLTTALARDELLREVRFPLNRGSGHAILECSRTHGNFAIAGAVSVLGIDDAGRAHDVSIVVFGSSARPTRIAGAISLLEGQEATDEVIVEAAERAAAEIEAIEDVHGSASFRRHLTSVYVKRSLARAIKRARKE